MFSWNEYLQFADTLSKQHGIGEKEFRISISRAYYAVFNNCSDKFFNLTQTQKPTSDTHKFIIEHYKKGKREAKAIGIHLDNLKASRVDCDYRASKTISKSIMDNAIKSAVLINTKLNSITEDHF